MNTDDLIKFEDDIAKIWEEGKIPFPVHLSGGNEAQLIEIFRQIKPGDYIFSSHRSHYHALLHGIDPGWVKSEILAGHSIHLMNKEHHFFTSAIVGGCLPIALGVAMAIKMRHGYEHVWCFVGDGAAETGLFYETTKYAARNGLHISFVVEDNGLMTNTPTQFTWGIKNFKPNIIRYVFIRTRPHINTGKWVVFS